MGELLHYISLPDIFFSLSLRHGATAWGVAWGGEGRVFGPRRCPEVGVGCFLSAWTSGATQSIQEERKSEDSVRSHQTEGDNTVHKYASMHNNRAVVQSSLNYPNKAHKRNLIYSSLFSVAYSAAKNICPYPHHT